MKSADYRHLAYRPQMTRKRKSAAERRQEAYEREQQAWESFRPKLEAVNTVADAFTLLGDSVAPGSPGRGFYSNLGFFLQTFRPPAGANVHELSEYLRLIGLFDDDGVIKEGHREDLEAQLSEAIARKVGVR